MVSEISDGLWLTIIAVTPYFLPSFTIRSIAKVDERNFDKLDFGTYLVSPEKRNFGSIFSARESHSS